MATAPEVTANDLLALPEGGPRYELLDGEVYQVNPPTRRHQEIVGDVFHWLYGAKNAGLGHPYVAPTGLVLPDGAMTEPDVMFIRAGREEVLAEDAIRGVPDLIVEVLSPTTRDRDRKIKYRIYERNDVPHFWWIDPDEETIYRHALGADGRYAPLDVLRRGDTLNAPFLPAEHAISVEHLFT
ncbi:MAG TPA: Uma2 family endonuclease [Thermomicrobiales bacterium]|nr:Uma2 family endonuclease [Thermomicrobiales bacterium]